AVAVLGDRGGAGLSDRLLGAPTARRAGVRQAGNVEARSGATGELLYRIEGVEAAAYFGRTIASEVGGGLDALDPVEQLSGCAGSRFDVAGLPHARPTGRGRAQEPIRQASTAAVSEHRDR